MSAKFDIPNSMIQELIKHQELLLKTRTSTGNPSFTSTSSSVTYTVSDNTGENGLMALLKTALSQYMVTANDWNGMETLVSNTTTALNSAMEDINKILSLGGLPYI